MLCLLSRVILSYTESCEILFDNSIVEKVRHCLTIVMIQSQMSINLQKLSFTRISNTFLCRILNFKKSSASELNGENSSKSTYKIAIFFSEDLPQTC